MEHLLPWFVLKSIPGIGNLLYKRLIDRFHSPGNAIEASYDELVKTDGVTGRLAEAIKIQPVLDAVQDELALVVKNNVRIVTLNDPDYPSLLREIADPPPYLYVYGTIANPPNTLAMVGSRNATDYGLTTTKRLSRDLAAMGITIVSGMAKGIDTAAHEGALMAKGQTIAVLGSGLGRIYPPGNEKLYYRIIDSGAVVSEFPFYAEPEAHHFPMRNRIISGVSLGTVIVEATLRSGSLITARLAAEQNREVFAVPGSIHSFKSTGTHTLIKQGAKLVEHPKDILEELQLRTDALSQNENGQRRKKLKTPLPMPSDEQLVLDSLDHYPVHIDDIARRLGRETGEVLGILLQLELKGNVMQSSGKLFSLIPNRNSVKRGNH
jgi:DNA processing protein